MLFLFIYFISFHLATQAYFVTAALVFLIFTNSFHRSKFSSYWSNISKCNKLKNGEFWWWNWRTLEKEDFSLKYEPLLLSLLQRKLMLNTFRFKNSFGNKTMKPFNKIITSNKRTQLENKNMKTKYLHKLQFKCKM